MWKGAKGWGQEGWGKGWGNDGGGEGGGEGGWGQALLKVFEQNRYRYIEFGYRHAHDEMKSAENRDFEGISPILAGNPHVMTSYSRKNVTFSYAKSPKMRCARDFI